MKVYFNYGREELMTEQEARKCLKKEILNDDYNVWEFIIDNYYYEEIMSHLSQDFLKEITEELINNQLENPDYFLVREFPD
jgi:hypothetical protein